MVVVQVLISGFAQHRGYAHGWYRLREKMLSEGMANGVSRRVWLEPWRVNTTNLAISLQILRDLYGEVKIGVYGYSYGGGYGSIGLVRKLDRLKIPVHKLILADPVFRPRWLPVPLPSPLSLLPFDFQPRIHVPGNVGDLVHFYQNVNLPQSPYLITNQVSGIVEHQEIGVRHQQVDDHEHVHETALRFARELCESPPSQSDFRDMSEIIPLRRAA